MVRSKGSSGVEAVFKKKTETCKKYVQVNCTFTNNRTQILAICTDISKIKSTEKHARRMRASFFSSVAHELRTPLNSIIPMLVMALEILPQQPQLERVRNFLRIVKNSSLHL